MLRLELVRFHRDGTEIIGAPLEGELHVSFFPAFGFSVDGDFVELVLGLVPHLEGQFGPSGEFLDFDDTVGIADTDVGVIGHDVICIHPGVDIAFDFGWTAFGFLDGQRFRTAGGYDLVPFFVVEEDELGVVAGLVGVFDFDGLARSDVKDVRNELAVHVIEHGLGRGNFAKGWMDLVVGELGDLGIDHKDHVRDPLIVLVHQNSLAGDLLFCAKRVSGGIQFRQGRRGTIENEFDGDIRPVLRRRGGSHEGRGQGRGQEKMFHGR